MHAIYYCIHSQLLYGDRFNGNRDRQPPDPNLVADSRRYGWAAETRKGGERSGYRGQGVQIDILNRYF